MLFPTPLLPGLLIRRYKRFMADIEMPQGNIVTAHVPNSGAMLGLTTPGSRVYVSPASNPDRKLAYTLEMVESDATWVGANTSHPNRLIQEAIESGQFSIFSGYHSLQREVKYGKNSRIDILLTQKNRPSLYVEVKNAHLRRLDRHQGRTAEFPDSVTDRGTKHLHELSDVVRSGHKALMVYMVQRNDCSAFTIAADIDPVYAKAYMKARDVGVEALCLSCTVTPDAITVTGTLPIVDPDI